MQRKWKKYIYSRKNIVEKIDIVEKYINSGKNIQIVKKNIDSEK